MTDNDYLGKDKLLHFAACALAALIHPFLAVGLAIGKEYGDSKATGNHWCYWDLLADALGIAIGSTIRYIILHELVQIDILQGW